MLARDIMTREVITIGAHEPIYRLTKLLAEGGISGVPVCEEDGRIVGMVEEEELLKMKKGTRVRDIMRQEVISVEADTPVEEVAAILYSKNLKRVPVYEKGELVGIISRSDIVAAMARRIKGQEGTAKDV
ncbi:MAG TPA: CBS domain-containing protein [Moorella mulderi]|nr:CBS domain-containing protein [Moorella mulderi]